MNFIQRYVVEHYGMILEVHELPTTWVSALHQPPQFIRCEAGQVVWHPGRTTDAIRHYQSFFDENGARELNCTPIITVFDEGYLTRFIPGTTIESPLDLLPVLAHLQRRFHAAAEGKYTRFWEQRCADSHDYLASKGHLFPLEKVMSTFTRYGLIHGDFSTGNIIHTPHRRLVLLDHEHMMEGPLAYDLARPLERICRTSADRDLYMDSYLQSGESLPARELWAGSIMFLLLQGADRLRWGYPHKAEESLHAAQLRLEEQI